MTSPGIHSTNSPLCAHKKVLFVYKQCEFGGGAEKNLIEVAEHVAKNNTVAFVITGGYVDPRMASIGRIHYFPSHGKLMLFPLDMLYLAYLIIRKRIDIIHAHHRYPAFLASLLRRLLRVKLLTTVHNRFPDKGNISLWGDKAIAVSHGVADWMIQECGVAPEKVCVIHNGIKPPKTHSMNELNALRVELNIPADTPVLCSVGRLTKQKNYACLLNALAMIKPSKWILLLVGEGEDRPALERQAAALGLAGRIRFLGHRKDVDKIMQISDLFVLSSAWEGFPYVIVEALANGLPLVSTDVGGVAEGVLDNVTGFLVPPGAERPLADKIGMLLSNPALRSSFSTNGRKLFREKFLDETMLARVDQEYAALLARQ